MALKAGGKTTEFWAMVGLAVMVVAGWANPEQVTHTVQSTGSPINALFDTVQNLLQNKGDLALYAGVLWAYIKRRSALKELDIGCQNIKGGKDG